MKSVSKFCNILLIGLLSVGCVHASVGAVRTPLQKGAILKTEQITVMPFTAEEAVFEGDMAADGPRITQEKQIIRDRLASQIARELACWGYQAEPFAGGANTARIVIEGKVTRFDHGSGAARWLVGTGAGSSDMFIRVRIYSGSRENVLADFDVTATSADTGGFESMGRSFLDEHIADGAEKIRQYILSDGEWESPGIHVAAHVHGPQCR
jgi:hypothetical protein